MHSIKFEVVIIYKHMEYYISLRFNKVILI